MLDISFIRTHPDVVRRAAEVKAMPVDLDRLLELDEQRRALISQSDSLREERNRLSDLVPTLKGPERQAAIERAREVGGRIKSVEAELASVLSEFDELMLRVPNVPAPEVPVGQGEEDNVEVQRWREPRQFDFEPRDHVALATSLGLVDFERPRRYAGSRSYALTGNGVLLELAVLRYALDTVIREGWMPVSPPIMVDEAALVGTGFFPFGRDDTYQLERDNAFLVGTSEVSLISSFRDQILRADELPIRWAGISPCFRREAGAHGRDTRGLYRVHQFQKVEQISICLADEEVARSEHYRLLRNSELILQGLELPYRVALACTGEIGIGQTRKHEVETWMPSRGKYSETHSCSTLTDFQARRSNIRYRGAEGIELPYTLNNTAVASPRILIPILEHYQNEDGSVTIPEVLRPYMGGEERLIPEK